MSKSRSFFPQRIYLITRRCTQRQFLLLPYPDITQAFGYCLALAQQHVPSIRIHAVCVLSNHFHLIATDEHAKLPAFMEYLDGISARCLNCYHGRWENFWEAGTKSYSAVELVDEEDVLNKMVYTLCNPVAAGLVPRGIEWPGLRSATLKQGPQRLVFQRPDFFFTENMPEQVEVLVEEPEGSWDLGDEETFGDVYHESVLHEERELRRKIEASGRPFLGRKGVLAQSPTVSPRNAEPRRELSPRYAARNKWRRVEKLQEDKIFLREYREALRKFAAGLRDVIFPAGTYWMRVHFGVECRAPP